MTPLRSHTPKCSIQDESLTKAHSLHYVEITTRSTRCIELLLLTTMSNILVLTFLIATFNSVLSPSKNNVYYVTRQLYALKIPTFQLQSHRTTTHANCVIFNVKPTSTMPYRYLQIPALVLPRHWNIHLTLFFWPMAFTDHYLSLTAGIFVAFVHSMTSPS